MSSFVCIGNQQYLKSRFGKGYSLTMSVTPGWEEQATQFVRSMYPTADLESAYNGTYKRYSSYTLSLSWFH